MRLRNSLLILALFFTKTAHAYEAEKLLEFGFAQDQINEAAHAFIAVELKDRHWAMRWNLSLVLTDDAYGAVDVGFRLQYPTGGPFIGIGAFYGQNEFCDIKDDSCDTDVTLGLYPEIGLNLWPTNNLRLSLFARYYSTLSKIDNDYSMLGIALGFR